MTDMVELFSIKCPECQCDEFVVMGIRDGYIYLVCLNDDCGKTIKWSMQYLDSVSYATPEVDIEQEPIRFKFPETETDKQN